MPDDQTPERERPAEQLAREIVDAYLPDVSSARILWRERARWTERIAVDLVAAREEGRREGLMEAAGLIRAEQQRLIDAVLMLPEGSEARARAAARVETAFQLEGKIEACAAGEKTADA
jgi:hypothetical protein